MPYHNSTALRVVWPFVCVFTQNVNYCTEVIDIVLKIFPKDGYIFFNKPQLMCNNIIIRLKNMTINVNDLLNVKNNKWSESGLKLVLVLICLKMHLIVFVGIQIHSIVFIQIKSNLIVLVDGF